jgi:hypothetical protein
MMKLHISIAGLLMIATGLHAQTTTYTGKIKDLALNPVTSGQVTFTLAPSTDSTLPGTGRFTPRTVTCIIRGDGTLASSSNGVSACQVANNTSLSPSGTSYRICIQPRFATPGSCFFDYATGGSKDISTVAPTLQTGPLNYSGTSGPPGKDGPAGAPGTITATGVNGSFLVPGQLTANINRWESPLSHGVLSNTSPHTVLATGSAKSGSLALSASSDFVVNQGVMISHAGAACGSVKGGDCLSAPTPAVLVKGAGGTTPYSYQLACIDGLGGIGPAGLAGTTNSGNANFAAAIPANEIAGHYTGNYNAISWSGSPACFEVAIYRNGALIASEYSAPSGTMTYNDIGIATWTNRDLPSAPPSAPINDNYVGFITAIGPGTATVSPLLGASVSGATTYHSDTPMIQAAINTPGRGSLDLGSAAYLVNYPINLTRSGSDVKGGGAILFADTGDIFMDLTGGFFEHLSGLNVNAGLTNPSTIGLYCSRDTTVGSDTAQSINTEHLILNIGANVLGTSHALGGRGLVGYYNHACEIQQNLTDHIEADRFFVLTSNNIDHVRSLFDANDDTSTQSMSAIDVISMTGGTQGTFAELDNAYSINFIGGYALGGPSTTHPYAFEFDPGESARFRSDGFRVEQKGGAVYISPNTTLREPYINMDLYRANETEPGVYIASGSNLIDADMVRIDDYGGSSVVVPLVDGAAGCSVAGSLLRIGVWENLGTCQLSGVGNSITGASLAIPSNDYSLNPGYALITGAGRQWTKLGTWVANANGSTLDIRIYSGAGANVAANQQMMADLIVRNANTASAPNLSGASVLTYGANPIAGVKIVATGGNTSPTNQKWDIYVETTGFSSGTYAITKQYDEQWINSDTLTGDPGPASSTVLVGTIQQVMSGYSATTGALPSAAIAAGACSNLTATAPGTTSGMAVIATPASTTQLIKGLHWDTAFVSAAGTITVPVCNNTAAPITPNITPVFNVRVIQ